MLAQELIKHTARLAWIDGAGQMRSEEHSAWTPRLATTMAWRRARSMITSGQARAYRMEHRQEVVQPGEVVDIPDDLAIPPAPRVAPPTRAIEAARSDEGEIAA